MKRLLGLVALITLLLAGPPAAHAIPILQLYIEGAHYDAETESWVASPPGACQGDPFRLWTIGNVFGPGGAGPIEDVRLAVSYTSERPDITVTLTPSVAGGVGSYEGFFDGFTGPSAPTLTPYSSYDWDKAGVTQWSGDGIPTSNGWWTGGSEVSDPRVVTDGSWPVLSSGKELPTHGSFGDGVYWQELYLGDFTQSDDTIADFIAPPDFPGEYMITDIPELFHQAGQVNVYEVSILNGGDSTVYFDLYNHVGGDTKAKAKFAPFSHDADIGHVIPEPGSYLVWLLIGLTWTGSAWVYQYWTRWRDWERQRVALATDQRSLTLGTRRPPSDPRVRRDVPS